MGNTRYVVVSGARKQEQDWDPEENGGFAIHGAMISPADWAVTVSNFARLDTDPDKPPDDPLAALEKTTIQKQTVEKVGKPRVEALQGLSDHYNADPYAQSSRLRKQFREEKKAEKRKRDADDEFKTRYSLSEDLALVPEDDDVREEAKEAWDRGKREFDRQAEAKRRALEVDVGSTPVARARGVAVGPSSSSSGSSRMPSRIATSKPSAKSTLASTLLINSLRRSDPFLPSTSGSNHKTGTSKPSGLSIKR
ncbi:hypothetical protein FRB99_006005 [Tulasnella sp. 403]|nr:hypothetical protein FRB99_006005 [Tulasnella sp. 403]